MLPGEIKHESLQVTKQALAEDEDYTKATVEETRLWAVQNMQAYQEETKRWRDKKVVRKKIQDGDLVLRKKPNADTVEKLQSKWEGPFTAKQTGRKGSFHLID